MARPIKCRRVCTYPKINEFIPDCQKTKEPIILTIDEYEVIRLIDKEKLSQENCGTQMGVSRTTAQKIYETARKKLAEALVMGLPIKIEGGDYNLCNGELETCYKKECKKRKLK